MNGRRLAGRTAWETKLLIVAVKEACSPSESPESLLLFRSQHIAHNLCNLFQLLGISNQRSLSRLGCCEPEGDDGRDRI